MKYCLSTLLLFAGLGYAQTPPASVLFDKDAVHEIRLRFAQSDYWEQLTKNYASSEDDIPYIEASLEWGEYKFASVGVRFKGNSSYNGATTKKKPFRIKLTEFVKGQKIDGMASFSLSNAYNDPSFVREKAYYEMAASAGLKAPRSGFAALYINDEYWGLYVLTEVVNGDFLKSFFGKGEDGGNLYKADIGASFSYLGTDAASYKNFFEKQSNEEADDWSDLMELSRVIDQTAVEEYPAKVGALVDVDSVLTALALDNLTVNLDSYVSMGQNFYIYRRPSDNRWVWIPWDPSLAFGGLSQGLSTQQMVELALEYVSATGMGARGGAGGAPAAPTGGTTAVQAARPLATKLWQVPEYKARYREIYKQLVEKWFIPKTVAARMNALRDMIGPWVAKDTQKLVTQTQYDQAMTEDMSGGMGGGTTPATPQFPGGDGTTPPQFPGGDGGQQPPANPGGGGVFPGGGDANGRVMGSVPGLRPFVEGRHLAVTALLAGQVPLSVSAAPGSIAVAQIAGAAASSQTVKLALSDASKSSTYTATSSAAWLTVSPASGTVPATLTVSISAGTLAAGTYSGTITVATAGVTNTRLSIPVTVTIASAASLVPSPTTVNLSSLANPFGGGGTQAASQTVQVLSTGGATSFSAAVASASCGNFFSVSPASGTTPATVTVTANSSSSTTSGSCEGTITFSATGMAAATVQVKMTVTSMPAFATPSITAIANAASYGTGAIAPGEIVTLFGANFGPQNLVSGAVSNGRLATTLNGMQVTFDGVAAPIVYARNDQMSVIVPFEVAGKQETSIQISGFRQQGTATALKQAVTAAAPGIFTLDASGTGNAAAAAAKGSFISIYLTGAGQLDPGGSTGAVAAASPLQKVVAGVTATVGGEPATVTYAGAVPGSVQGLYQVNLQIPQTVASGSQAVQLTIAGMKTQNKVTITVL